MPAIPYQESDVVDRPWDGPANVARIPNDAGEQVLRQMFAWVDPDGDPETKAAYKLAHHEVGEDGTVGAANASGVRNALSRMMQTKPPLSATDEAEVRSHLQEHLDDLDEGGDDGEGEAGRSVPLPADNLVRAVFPADIQVRDASDLADPTPTLVGHFAVFDTFTEIRSSYEGHFLERIAPGAFKKTIQENRQNIRVLFQHGRDPQIGDKVLGIPTVLEEDRVGARYEVPLLDTSYNRDLEPGLRAGAYGASFRFSVVKEDVNRNPERSDHNPQGLPERTIQELRLMEFGPVTFPAYEGATAGVRSLTDDFLPGGRFAPGTDVRANLGPVEDAGPTIAEEEPPHSPDASRDTPSDDERRATNDDDQRMATMESNIETMRSRQSDIKRELEEIYFENRGNVLSAKDQARWDGLEAEWEDLEKRIESDTRMAEKLLAISGKDEHREAAVPASAGTGVYVTRRSGRDQTPEDVFDTTRYHTLARDQTHMLRLIGEGAKRALETFDYPHPQAEKARVNGHIEKLLRDDSQDKEIAQRILNCGSPAYKRAFFKHLTSQPMTVDEQRALAVGAVGTGQAAVPIDLDPTLIPTSNLSLNPFRGISRVVTTTSYQWNGVTSGGVTANYRAEGAVMTDNSPTLTQPTITPERVDVFIPFSLEIAGDWSGLESQLAIDIQDAKDTAESSKFSSGTGHSANEPRGVLYGAYTAGPTLIGSTGATAFGVADLYALEAALPARHQPNAVWVATPAMFARVRQLDTQGGANMWVQLQGGNPPELLGYPAYKASNVGTAGPLLTSSAKWGVFGDFSRGYVIVDRVGMSISIAQHLFSSGTSGGLTYPTGQSGLIAFWRNSAAVVDSNAFRIGTIT